VKFLKYLVGWGNIDYDGLDVASEGRVEEIMASTQDPHVEDSLVR
jgi:hypothetical protein